jgi:multidrug efflux pump
MKWLIDTALNHTRGVLLLFGFLVIAGAVMYTTIPKESSPDVQIPYAVVIVSNPGISPEDAERLLVAPAETALQNIEGLKQMKSQARPDYAVIFLEFHVGQDLNKAITNVRNQISIAKNKFPDGTYEPVVKEINLSLFPVITVQLSGNVPERFLYGVAKDVQTEVENLNNVLEAKLVGGREEVLEIMIDPVKLQAYNISVEDIIDLFARNNLMVPAGNINIGGGNFSLKTPGLLQTEAEILNIPLKASLQAVVRIKDVAIIRRTYKDVKTFARSWGKPAVTLEVSKRLGKNIIETIQKVRNTVGSKIEHMKNKISVTYAQDMSDHIKSVLKELQNNIVMAIFLVMLVIIGSLGWRASILVGLAIPVSFLSAIFFMGLAGITLNNVVLFSLILSVGMLVDGAIIVVEYADRKIAEGNTKQEAYREAAYRMTWPVISSITTIIVVFLPLLFWPGIVGQFMRYLPLTLIATLSMSLLVALILVPVLGSMFGKIDRSDREEVKELAKMETLPLDKLHGLAGFYIRLVDPLLNHPIKVILSTLLILGIVLGIYGKFGHGVEFFPKIEPDTAVFLVRARGNHSVEEKDKIMRNVEAKLLHAKEFKNVYSSSGLLDNVDEDVIGKISVEFINWQQRPPAGEILESYLKKTDVIPGVKVEVEDQKSGPSQGKAIQIELTATDYTLLRPEISRIRKYLETVPGLIDIEDSSPMPGIEWQIQIDRAEAAKAGASIRQVGGMIQLIGDGVKVSTYKPKDSKEELDVVLRFPKEHRTLKQLDHARLYNRQGHVPLSSFIKRVPKQRIQTIERVDGFPVLRLKANTASKVLPAKKVQEIQTWLAVNPGNPGVEIKFKGEEQDKRETEQFLTKAFATAIFLILIILVSQFNSFFSSFLVLSAVLLSTIGVFLGLLIMGQPFGIVMTGIGIIALSGIIVSNNIIFIDTFDTLSKTNKNVREVILRTGALRLRPIILTKLTAILGLLPIMLRMDIDFLGHSITVGAPSSEWWVQLSTAIVYGIMFASLITLIVTPCALMLRANYYKRFPREHN